jgi:glutathione S-transferase
VKARLYVIPASHPSWTGRLLVERKGIPYKRTDLVAVVSRGVLRAAGFRGSTVPALKLDGRRIQGSREISRELDAMIATPPLFGDGPQERARIEDAERWGDEVLQSMARRIVWNLLSRDRSGLRSYLEGARLGMPLGVAAGVAGPVVFLAKRLNRADDAAVRRDIAALPGALDKVDGLIAEGVIGGAEPNAADLQIAPSIALLMTMEDIRSAIADRPCTELARRLVPSFPGFARAAFPAEWLLPLRGTAPRAERQP